MATFVGSCTEREARGYALLLAVVITSAVLTAGSALAAIILSEIRQTRQIRGAIEAQANAEGGIEKALFLLRNTDETLSDVATQADATVESYSDPQYFTVPENDFVALPVSGDMATTTVAPQIIAWVPERATCPDPNRSWIEVTTVSWDTRTDSFQTTQHPYSYGSDRDTVAKGVSFGSETPVELRVRALYCDIAQLGIQGIPGRVRIVRTGESGGNTQAIETLMVRHAPASGLFDFVIFSECDVVKGGGSGTHC